MDWLVTEAEMRYGKTAGLLRVVCEISLSLFISIVAYNLDRVFIGADGTVRTDAPELAGYSSGRNGLRVFGVGERQVGNVVFYADSKAVERLLCIKVAEDGENICRCGVLGTETVTTADNGNILKSGAADCGNNIEVKRFAQGTGFF